MKPGLDSNDSNEFPDLSALESASDRPGVASVEKRLPGSRLASLKLVADGAQSVEPLIDGVNGDSNDCIEELAKRQAAVLGLLTQLIDQTSLQTCINAAVGELQQQFLCDRVVLGICRQHSVEVSTISQQVKVDARSGEVLLLSAALQEACDQDCTVRFPAIGESLVITKAHETLASGSIGGQICSIPLYHNEILIGAVLLEKIGGEVWNSTSLELQEQMAAVIAPVLALRQLAEAGLGQRVRMAAKLRCRNWLGPRHLRAKLAGLLLFLMLFAAYFIQVNHYLRMSGELVSSEKRLITSPIQGYIDSVQVVVGDEVEKGQPLLRLDVRDLELQVEKLSGEIQSAKSEYRSAMASHDRADMAVAQAQLEQSRAELRLMETQIERARLHAPVDGTIISGDLSQMIGAPVDRGSTLLEIAPSGDHQIQLLLNETEIGYAEVGQRGTLSLRSSPGDEIHFRVASIHPIAIPQEGVTRFRIDAVPTQAPDGLRPGQTGFAKIEAGKASLLWIWTHRFVSWISQQLWGWFG